MKVEIRCVVDLGECAETADLTADTKWLCRAVGEAVEWHGRCVRVSAYRGVPLGAGFVSFAEELVSVRHIDGRWSSPAGSPVG